MKAWVLHGIDDLRWETVEKPLPGSGEVLVAVKAVGICGSDIPRIYKTGAHVHPLIPGHELSGRVEAVGAGVESSWLGQRVGIFPLIPCKTCTLCQEKRYEMCRNYSYIGSRRDGGFAEYVTVPVWNLLKLPEEVSYEEAAMLEPMAVAVHAMRRAVLSASGTIVVCGLGTIGMLLLMFLLEAGFSEKIFTIGNKDVQKRTAMKMGIPENHYCDIRMQDATRWLAERTDGKGTDVFFECVGKKETFSLAVQSAGPLGQVILIGNPAQNMGLEKSVYWNILRNQITVMGVWNSSFFHDCKDDWNYVLKRLSHKQILPADLISHRFSMAELERGLKIMCDKTEDYGKIMGVCV